MCDRVGGLTGSATEEFPVYLVEDAGFEDDGGDDTDARSSFHHHLNFAVEDGEVAGYGRSLTGTNDCVLGALAAILDRSAICFAPACTSIATFREVGDERCRRKSDFRFARLLGSVAVGEAAEEC